MPTYTFLNKDTGKSWEEMMGISESEKFLKENPNIQKVPVAINMVRSVMGQRSMQTDSGWKDNLSRIAEAHPSSNLATTILLLTVIPRIKLVGKKLTMFLALQ